jgi:hypothetical protein
MPVILATCGGGGEAVKIGRIVVLEQPKQKATEIPSQPIAGCGGTYLSDGGKLKIAGS